MMLTQQKQQLQNLSSIDFLMDIKEALEKIHTFSILTEVDESNPIFGNTFLEMKEEEITDGIRDCLYKKVGSTYQKDPTGTYFPLKEGSNFIGVNEWGEENHHCYILSSNSLRQFETFVHELKHSMQKFRVIPNLTIGYDLFVLLAEGDVVDYQEKYTLLNKEFPTIYPLESLIFQTINLISNQNLSNLVTSPSRNTNLHTNPYSHLNFLQKMMMESTEIRHLFINYHVLSNLNEGATILQNQPVPPYIHEKKEWILISSKP